METLADQVLQNIRACARQMSDPGARANFYALQADILNASVELDNPTVTIQARIKHQLARQMLETALGDASEASTPAELAILHRALAITLILLNEEKAAQTHLTIAQHYHCIQSAAGEELIDLAYAAFITPAEITNRNQLEKARKRLEKQAKGVIGGIATCSDAKAKAEALCLLANWYIDCRELERAREYLSQGLQLAKQSGSSQVVGVACLYLGIIDVYLEQQRERGIEWFMSARSAYQKANDRQGEIECLFQLGSVYWDKGEFQRSLESWESALIVHKERNEPADVWAMARIDEFIQLHQEYAAQIAYASRPQEDWAQKRNAADTQQRGAAPSGEWSNADTLIESKTRRLKFVDQNKFLALIKKHFQFLVDDYDYRCIFFDEHHDKINEVDMTGYWGRAEFYKQDVEVDAKDYGRHTSFLQALAIFKANQPVISILWDENQNRIRVLFYSDQPVLGQFYDVETIAACKAELEEKEAPAMYLPSQQRLEPAIERCAWLAKKYALPWRPKEMGPLLNQYMQRLNSAWTWANCNDPLEMLKFLHNNTSARKLRLFVCGYWRLTNQSRPPERKNRLNEAPKPRWEIPTEQRFAGTGKYDSQEVGIEIAEDVADGLASAADLQSAEKVLSNIHYSGAGWEHLAPALSNAQTACTAGAWAAAQNIDPCPVAMTQVTGGDLEYESNVIREIFGNPFIELRPPNPAWLTPEVFALAQDIYQNYSFEKLPKLADLLAKAGCNRKNVLAHLKSANRMSLDPYYQSDSGGHVRGCWALDWVLGKT